MLRHRRGFFVVRGHVIGMLGLCYLMAACTMMPSPTVPIAGSIPQQARGERLQRAVVDLRTQRFVAFDDMADELAQAQVVAVGEEHYHPAIQAFELHLLASLVERRPGQVVLAMEFLERDMQEAVNAYLAGTMEATVFHEQINASPDFIALYFPLLQFARQQGLPVLALNVPRRLARQVAKTGLQATLRELSDEERAYLPTSLAVITPAYRTYFLDAVGDFHPPENAQQADRLVESSHIKDDTMAAVLASFLVQRPEVTVLALAGRFHTDYGTAIPRLLAQRLPNVTIRRLTTLTVEPNTRVNLHRLAQERVADYLWLAPARQREQDGQG